jgi:HEAT repeat protein
MKRTVAIAIALVLAPPLFCQTPREQAWTLLQTGLTSSKSETRVIAVRVLGVITFGSQGVTPAEQALTDSDPDVRAAAAVALGSLKAKSSIPKLRAALKDQSGSVVMAVAKSLTILGDETGFGVYYAIVTGQHKSGEILMAGQEKELNDLMHHPNELAEQAFEQGIGFVPFGGVGLQAYQAIHGDQEKEILVRANAVKMLADDPDPLSGKALVTATSDKEWVVRAAAFDALARRGDRSLVPDAANGLSDSNDTAKFMAAAAVVQLSTPANPAAK